MVGKEKYAFLLESCQQHILLVLGSLLSSASVVVLSLLLAFSFSSSVMEITLRLGYFSVFRLLWFFGGKYFLSSCLRRSLSSRNIEVCRGSIFRRFFRLNSYLKKK